MKHFKLAAWLLLGVWLLPAVSYSQFTDFDFLRVDNFYDGYNKVKLGNNPDSFWNPKVDVTAGGNTHMSITFRMPEGSPDYSRIQIRPNGSSASPVSLGSYLPAGFSNSYDWTTIHIPLADLNSAIDLTQLYLIQIPYSADAGNFVFDLKRLEFTGGSTPYLWYGAGKRGNIHDGDGYEGQPVAHEQSDLYLSAELDYSKAVAPYNGSAKLIATYKDQYDQEAFDHLWTWSDGHVGRERNDLAPGPYQVVFGPMDGAYDTLKFDILTLGPIEGQMTLTSPTTTEAGAYEVEVTGGLPDYTSTGTSGSPFYDDKVQRPFYSNFRGPFIFGNQDYYGNYYLGMEDKFYDKPDLFKINEKAEVIWQKNINSYYLRQGIFRPDDIGNILTFQKVRKESLIEGKRYKSEYEKYALVLYNAQGEFVWAKYFDDLFLSVDVMGMDIDKQGKIAVLLRKFSHRGNQYIFINMGMNGNEIARLTSTNVSPSAYWSQYQGQMVVVDSTNQIFLLLKQSAGTIFAGHMTNKESFHLYRFSPDLKLEKVRAIGNYFLPIWRGNSEDRLLFAQGETSDDRFLRYYDENGRQIWQRPYAIHDIRRPGKDVIYYVSPEGVLTMINYELDTVGQMQLDNRAYSFYEDRKKNIIYIPGGQRSGPVEKHTLIASESGTIPAGSTSFTYQVTDQIDNKYTYSASFVSSRVGADQEGIGLTQGRGALAIYPNPSTSDIQFRYSEGLPVNALTLTDLSGRVIQSWRDIPADGFTIPRNGLKAGIYLVTYEDAEMKQTERIVFR